MDLVCLQTMFDVGKVQMKFLHLLSITAAQSISLHCYNDPATVVMETPPSLRFQGWNGHVFEEHSSPRPHELPDNCEVREHEFG